MGKELSQSTGTVFEDIHPRMKLFADEWLTGAATGKRFNGRAAYLHAGYKLSAANPSSNASKLLRHPKVAAYIKSQLEEHAMDAQEVLLRFTAIARSEFGDILKKHPQSGRMVIDHDELEKHKQYIKSFGYDSNGNLKVEFHDSMDALKQITRVLGMFKDQLQVTGPGGGPMTLAVRFVMPDGSQADLGPTNMEEIEPEDFSDIDEMTEELPMLGPGEDVRD